jgi:triphosphatase
MTTEIELKFIVTQQAILALPQFLAQWANHYEGKQSLLNTYYETPDNFLRSHDMGLRIRSFEQSHEMTLKAGGRVIAGLHQRPEYNISLDEPKLALSLLPNDIWPQGTDLAELEQRLTPLFTTHFIREKWLISYESSEIELALDRGEISANELCEPLNEIELELKEGDISDVLAFAIQFSELGGIRLSHQSKAARGYRLASQGQSQSVQPFPIIHIPAKATVEQGLSLAIEQTLGFWQYHESVWLAGNRHAKNRLIFAIAALRQIWVIWGGLIPRKSTAKLREQLQQVEELIIADDDPMQVCYQTPYAQTKLALTQWIVERQWLMQVSAAEQEKLGGSFKRFADIMLSRSAKMLKEAFCQLQNDQEYKDRRLSLRRQIIAFYVLAGAYPTDDVIGYIQPWQELSEAIEQNHVSEWENLRRRALSQPAFWLNGSQR